MKLCINSLNEVILNHLLSGQRPKLGSYISHLLLRTVKSSFHSEIYKKITRIVIFSHFKLRCINFNHKFIFWFSHNSQLRTLLV